MARANISQEVQARLLAESRRRCAICFGIHGDLEPKKGQIAHLDRDSSNPAEENLMFLCLVHHDEYDTKTSQSKGLIRAEVVKYYDEMLAELERRWSAGALPAPPPPSPMSVVFNISNVGGAGGAARDRGEHR